jgi:hypothetical protein
MACLSTQECTHPGLGWRAQVAQLALPRRRHQHHPLGNRRWAATEVSWLPTYSTGFGRLEQAESLLPFAVRHPQTAQPQIPPWLGITIPGIPALATPLLVGFLTPLYHIGCRHTMHCMEVRVTMQASFRFPSRHLNCRPSTHPGLHAIEPRHQATR